MRSFRRTAGVAALAFTLAVSPVLAQSCTCQSFGSDFVDGGSYFQNTLSSVLFNATEYFEGCDADTADNILTLPNGDQLECGNTNLTPDDALQTFTCPIEKNALTSGDYSLIIISNNGAGCPIDYMRDFSISAGPQATTSVPATITVSVASTVVESDTTTTTTTITSSARASTVTVPAININPVVTIVPLPAVTDVTKALLTVTSVDVVPDVVATTTTTVTAACAAAQGVNKVADPKNTIKVTIQPLAALQSEISSILSGAGIAKRNADAAALPVPTAGAGTLAYKRAILEGRIPDPDIKARFVKERRERLAQMNKRAPDVPTLTVTDLALPTSTSTDVTSTLTSTIIVPTTVVQTTVTTPVVTVSKGINFSIKTVTAAKQTITLTEYIPVTEVTSTTTSRATLAVTSTVPCA